MCKKSYYWKTIVFFSFVTGDGVKVENSGIPKQLKDENGNEVVVIAQKGLISYTLPDGTPISYSFMADETGFHPLVA